MNKQIWQFLAPVGKGSIKMPVDAEILGIQTLNGNPHIFALVNPENDKESRYFETYATGHNIFCDMGIERNYIGTFQAGGILTFHLFERL